MKHMRLAMWVAVFALVGGIAISGDMDIQALQAKLQAQEARLNDLQAKMNSSAGAAEADSVLSIRKNAIVKIGGQLNTRYYYGNGEIKSNVGGDMVKTKSLNWADFRISDAKINFAVQVNDYFDAFFQVNMGDGPRMGGSNSTGPGGSSTGISTAQRAWVRWKNVCNTGFGLLVGRGDLVFGAGNQGGMVLTGWAGGNDMFLNGWASAIGETGGWSGATAHQGWDVSRTTQVTPYWEGMGGKLKIEASVFQAQDFYDGGRWNSDGSANGGWGWNSVNNGLGSVSGRITAKPIEGLTLVASAINRKASDAYLLSNLVANRTYGDLASNNTAVNFGITWTPCFFPRLDVFGQYIHGWNEGWFKDLSSDTVNFGFGIRLTEQLKFVAQADYIRLKRGTDAAFTAQDGYMSGAKTTGWAFYPALRYTLPYGVNIEAGYRYETLNWKDGAGAKQQEGKLHTVYGQLGFDF